MRSAPLNVAIALAALCSASSLAAIADPAPGAAGLDQLSQSLNRAQSISFSATAWSSAKFGGTSGSYRIAGALQKPNRIDVTVSSLGGVKADPKLPAAFVCDGVTYTVIAGGMGRYAQAAAPKEGFEPDSPDVMYFIYNVLSGAGPAALNTSELFFPADFNIGNEKLPDGMTRTIVVTDTRTIVDGDACTDIAQRVTGAHGTKIYHTVIDNHTDRLVAWSIDQVGAGGKAAPLARVVFDRLVTSDTALAAASFDPALPRTATRYETPAAPGSPAPDFTVATSEGKAVKLSDYAGKVIVIDFWATWCPPCRKTLPDTDKLAGAYQPKGVVFLPICTWDTKADFDQWAPAHKSWAMTWLFDPAADSGDKSIATRLYAVSGIPTQYVIGKDGKILYRGFADSDAGNKPLTDAILSGLAAR